MDSSWGVGRGRLCWQPGSDQLAAPREAQSGPPGLALQPVAVPGLGRTRGTCLPLLPYAPTLLPACHAPARLCMRLLPPPRKGFLCSRSLRNLPALGCSFPLGPRGSQASTARAGPWQSLQFGNTTQRQCGLYTLSRLRPWEGARGGGSETLQLARNGPPTDKASKFLN